MRFSGPIVEQISIIYKECTGAMLLDTVGRLGLFSIISFLWGWVGGGVTYSHKYSLFAIYEIPKKDIFKNSGHFKCA